MYYIYLESDVRKGEGEYEGVVRPGRRRWSTEMGAASSLRRRR